MMDSILNWLLGIGGGFAITAIAGLIATYIKKGDFKKWGVACGKALSKFADAKIGSGRWEKLEDAITIALVSFATGVKEGADYDDEEIKLLSDKNNVGKLNKAGVKSEKK